MKDAAPTRELELLLVTQAENMRGNRPNIPAICLGGSGAEQPKIENAKSTSLFRVGTD
jgi:hypothetical protein